VVAGGAGGGQPDAERQQQGGDQQVEDAGAGNQFDPDDRSGDHAGQGPGDQDQREPPAGLVLPPVLVQRAGGGDHVVEQVGGGDGGAGRAQHADLERQQQDRPGDARRSGHGRDGEGRRQGHGLGPPSAEHLATVTGSGPRAHPMPGKFAQVKRC
jgi:hypothetical protein